MSYLLDLLSIAAAIFLVLKIQQLRAILALPLARHDTTIIEAPPADARDPINLIESSDVVERRAVEQQQRVEEKRIEAVKAAFGSKAL